MVTAANLFTMTLKRNYQTSFGKKNQVKWINTFPVILREVHLTKIRATLKAPR